MSDNTSTTQEFESALGSAVEGSRNSDSSYEAKSTEEENKQEC
jgi:hypothetical protein